MARRGRDRRRGARGPRPLGARRRRGVHRPGRRRGCFAATRRGGAGRARPLRRAPAAELRRATRTRCSRATRGWRTACVSRADEPRAARPARGRRARRGGVPRGRGADRQRRGVRAAGHRLARLRVAPLLALRARTTGGSNALRRDERHAASGSPSSTATPPTPAACRTRSTRSREHGWVHHIPRLMVLGSYAAAARLGADAGDRLVPPGVRRRLRLGDGAQRRRDVAARGRRGDGDQAVHLGRRLHQPDERPLRLVPLRPEGAGGGRRLPVHRGLLVVPRPAPRAASPATTGCGGRCRGWTGSRTSTSSSSRRSAAATGRREPPPVRLTTARPPRGSGCSRCGGRGAPQ